VEDVRRLAGPAPYPTTYVILSLGVSGFQRVASVPPTTEGTGGPGLAITQVVDRHRQLAANSTREDQTCSDESA
jgi:hypothetical protein